MFLTNGNWKSFPRVIMTLQHLRAGIAQSATRVKYSLETMRAEHWILNRDKLNRNHTMRIYAKYLDDVPSCNLKIRWRSSNFPSLLSIFHFRRKGKKKPDSVGIFIRYFLRHSWNIFFNKFRDTIHTHPFKFISPCCAPLKFRISIDELKSRDT